MSVTCNIDKNQRTAYYVLGVVLILGAILDFSKFFVILLGLGLIVEAYLGWCSIPYLMDKFGMGKGGHSGDSTPPL